MSTAKLSFGLGMLTMLPALPVAWILGSSEEDARPSVGGTCACTFQPDRMDEIRSELHSLTSLITRTDISAGQPNGTAHAETSAVALREQEVDLPALVEAAVRRCFASYWTFSADDKDGIQAAIVKAGRTPFDDGVIELATTTRLRLSEEYERFVLELSEIKSKYPLVVQSEEAAKRGEGVRMDSKDQQQRYASQFSEFAKEQNPLAAQHEQRRKAIVQEFLEALR